MKTLEKNMKHERNRVYNRRTSCKGKTHRLVSWVNLFSFFCALLFIPITAQGQFSGTGNGVVGDPFIIKTAAHLNEVRNNYSAYYELGNDIDLEDYLSSGGSGGIAWGARGWLPIGENSSAAFTGNFNGKGFAISGLWINRSNSSDLYTGLFGYVHNAIIENLGIELSAAGVTGYNQVGGLVGRYVVQGASISAHIKNCYVIGNVKGFSNVGGLVGVQASYAGCTSVIEKCYSSGTVSGHNSSSHPYTGNALGGLVGYRFTAGTSRIDNCYSTSDVAGNQPIGGLVGDQSTGELTRICATYITNSYATGAITGEWTAGGLVGRQTTNNNTSTDEILNCFTTGNIEVPPGAVTGGLVGGIVGLQNLFAGSYITLSNNFRYCLATVNNSLPLTDVGPGARNGDVNPTAVDLMTMTTYSSINNWLIGATGASGVAWFWDDDEKYPMLGFGPETYPFPFYAIDYDLDGGTFSPPAPTFQYSYVPGNTYALPLDVPVKTRYRFDGWVDSNGLSASGITSSETGHKTFKIKWTRYIFDVTIAPYTKGSVVTDKTSAQAGETITLTVTPNAGYNIASLIVHETGNEANVIATTGSYTFSMPAFDVTVKAVFSPNYYSVSIQNPSYGGSISTDKTSVPTDGIVLITLIPNAGYELFTISAVRNGTTVSVPLRGSGIYRTFTMPGYDVTVSATFRNPTYLAAWDAALVLIENATFRLSQASANSEEDIRHELAILINQLISGTGFVVSPYDIVPFSLQPAIAGSADNRTGTNGFFGFRVTPPETRVSAYNDGTITATIYDSTGNDTVSQAGSLKAWTQDGKLHVTGVTAGNVFQVYNLTGVLIYQGTVTDSQAEVVLPSRGMFLITSGGKALKVVN